MADPHPDAATQICPACGTTIDLSESEPLARVECPNCGEKLRVERAFDNFILLETLGVGGMGSVYKARDARLDRFVALKLLRTELSADPAEAARLEQEARATAAVNHPHVIQVLSSGYDHRQFYIVMELVEQGSLDDLMAQHGRIPEAQVLSVGIQVAQGLQAAYEKGLIHRDVKPANILFANETTAKIGDFGLAVAAEQNAEARNEIWGTPYYVAPERLNSEPEDFRSDIYSLGATLFHAIAGRPPIEGETNSATLLRELKTQPLDLRQLAPEISKPTARVIARTLAPNPSERFESYAAFIDQLQRAYDRLTGVGRLSRKQLIVAIAALLLVFGGAAAYLNHLRKAQMLARPVNDGLSVSLNQLFDDARHQLVAGKIDAARTQFGQLSERAKGRQPLLNWVLFHRGLASLMRGYTTQARQPFHDIVNAGLYSNKASDAELARFFVDTARQMISARAVPKSKAAEAGGSGAQPFALLLFALKDWYLRDFDTAAVFLNEFMRSQPTAEFRWIAEYKPIAQKYLADYAVFADWQKQSRSLQTPEQISAALTSLRAAIPKLQTHGPITETLTAEEVALSQKLAEKQGATTAASVKEDKQLLEQQRPVWNKMFAAAEARSKAYDFAGAAAALNTAALTQPELKAQQEAAKRRAQWLIEWKDQLIAELNRRGFNGAVTDVNGAPYNGIAAATADRLTMKIPHGSAELEWTKLAPSTLLNVATALIVPNAPDVPDRQWRCAVFASEMRLSDAARSLARAAASAKPEYGEQLKFLRR